MAKKLKTDEAFWALQRKASTYHAAALDLMKGRPSPDASVMERGMSLYLDAYGMKEDSWDIFYKLNPKASKDVTYVAKRNEKVVEICEEQAA